MFQIRALFFTKIILLCQFCAHAYLVNKWSAQEWASGFFTNKCHQIPKNMTLCYGIGYDQMRLPNLLNHESVDEAVQQSNIWNLLDKTKCHDDLRVFLCSLYAPVCLKEGRERQIIKPCRSLCHLVRDNCVPRMRMFGYEWPAIARCDKFPDQTHLCIPPREQQKPESRTCKACDQAITFENIVSSYCMAKVVMKAKMKAFREDQSMLFIDIHRKRRYFRSSQLTSQQLKTIAGQVTREENCVCPELKKAKRHSKFLIMGNRNPRTGLLDIMFITPWKRKNRSFKRATRAIRKNRKLCQRQKIIDQHYTISARKQRPQQRNFPPPIRRQPELDPMGLSRGIPLPLPANFNREITEQIEEPMLPGERPIMETRIRPTIPKPSRPMVMPGSRNKSQRKGQRDSRRGNQRQGRKKKGRRRKDQRNFRKGRGRGKGNRNKKGRGRNNHDSKKKRKRKRKRKIKTRRNIFNRYYRRTS